MQAATKEVEDLASGRMPVSEESSSLFLGLLNIVSHNVNLSLYLFAQSEVGRSFSP